MNRRGQQEWPTIFVAALILLFAIVISGMLIDALYCVDEKAEKNKLQSQINICENELKKTVEDANFFKNQYETLRDQNITKQDFTDLKLQIADLNYNLTQINTQLTTINQQIQYHFDVFSLSIGLNFVLLPLSLFTLFDIAFLNLKYTTKTRVILLSIVTKIKQSIKIKKEKK